MNTRPALACALVLVLWTGAASARTVEGRSFPEERTIAGQRLQLVGVGVRKEWLFDVYFLAAYSKDGKQRAFSLLGEQPKLAALKFLVDVRAGRLASFLRNGVFANADKEDHAKLQAPLTQLLGLFPDPLPRGSEVELSYRPKHGTTLRIGGEEKGTIAGATFARALWSVWFGSKPADRALRRAVLDWK